jgi:hypothetical protein
MREEGRKLLHRIPLQMRVIFFKPKWILLEEYLKPTIRERRDIYKMGIKFTETNSKAFIQTDQDKIKRDLPQIKITVDFLLKVTQINLIINLCNFKTVDTSIFDQMLIIQLILINSNRLTNKEMRLGLCGFKTNMGSSNLNLILLGNLNQIQNHQHLTETTPLSSTKQTLAFRQPIKKATKTRAAKLVYLGI